MSGAHRVAWWGGLDPFTFVVWIATQTFVALPNSGKAIPNFWQSLMTRPDAEHVKYVDSLSDHNHRVIALTAFTAYTHEWRHWYDLTSTPWGMARTALLLDFYLTLLGLDEELRAVPEVFVPLSTWLSRPQIVSTAYPHLMPLSPEVLAVPWSRRIQPA